MRIRYNLGSIIHQNTNSPFIETSGDMIGIIFGVVTTKDTPTENQYKRAGSSNSIGVIFYKEFNKINDYDNVIIDDNFLNTCQIAKPYSSNIPIPLVGELVNIKTSSSPFSTISQNANESYYTNIINAYNNIQHNSVYEVPLGNTFIEKSDIRNLIPFEGDNIIQGRKGNGIRFGSTIKKLSNINEWSDIGEDGDPITILVNGYITSSGSLEPNIEEINKEKSSIWLTSTQRIPLIPDRNDILNPLTKPILINKYFSSSQILFNSGRIVLNSKEDDLFLFAKKNIEINTNNIINLNAGNRTHINSPVILLGTKPDGESPTEPLLLGNKTKKILIDLISTLNKLGNDLSSVISTPKGSPLVGVNTAGSSLVSSLQSIQNNLKEITSENNFTT